MKIPKATAAFEQALDHLRFDRVVAVGDLNQLVAVVVPDSLTLRWRRHGQPAT